jgi:hypothetical protein
MVYIWLANPLRVTVGNTQKNYGTLKIPNDDIYSAKVQKQE